MLLSRPVAAALLMAILLVAALPTGSAGSQSDPEMPDNQNDVDPLSLAGLKPEELDFVEGNLSMFDITSAWVTTENRDGFWFVVEVNELNGGLAPPDPTVPMPPMYATFEVYFQTGEDAWIARAVLEPWYEAEPPFVFAGFLANFTLHQDDADQSLIDQISGVAHIPTNALYFYVPKALVAEPEVGSEMTGMYAVSRFQHQVLDFAPDAAVDPTAIDPTGANPKDPLRVLFSPNHGRTYEFGQFPGSGAAARLELTSEGDTTVEVEKGSQADLSVRVKNIGNSVQSVRFGTTTPSGWTVDLDQVEMTLQPGSSDALIITASPSEKARSPGVLRISASTSMETQTLVFALKTPLAEGGDGSSAGGPSRGGAPNQSLEDSDEKDAPGPAVVLLLVALAGLGAAARRRR